MTISKEQAMAFIDGELSPEDERHLASEIAHDPELASYVERQTALKANLAAAFEAIMNAPIPERIEHAVQTTQADKSKPNGMSTLAKALRRLWDAQGAGAKRSWIPAGAMAVGIGLGLLLANALDDAPLKLHGGAMAANGTLAKILQMQLASEQDEEDTTRIGVSFWDRDGDFCRSFTTPGLQGIACRGADDWRIAALSTTAPGPQAEYQAAASAMPPELRSAMQDMISGEPLDANGERQARDQGWRAR